MAVTLAELTKNHFTDVVLSALFRYFRLAHASNLQSLKHLYDGGVPEGVLTGSFPGVMLEDLCDVSPEKRWLLLTA